MATRSDSAREHPAAIRRIPAHGSGAAALGCRTAAPRCLSLIVAPFFCYDICNIFHIFFLCPFPFSPAHGPWPIGSRCYRCAFCDRKECSLTSTVRIYRANAKRVEAVTDGRRGHRLEIILFSFLPNKYSNIGTSCRHYNYRNSTNGDRRSRRPNAR